MTPYLASSFADLPRLLTESMNEPKVADQLFSTSSDSSARTVQPSKAGSEMALSSLDQFILITNLISDGLQLDGSTDVSLLCLNLTDTELCQSPSMESKPMCSHR